jgi:hypothetical protein
MLRITIIVCKFGQKFKPLIRSQSKNGQATYKVPVSIQVGK